MKVARQCNAQMLLACQKKGVCLRSDTRRGCWRSTLFRRLYRWSDLGFLILLIIGNVADFAHAALDSKGIDGIQDVRSVTSGSVRASRAARVVHCDNDGILMKVEEVEGTRSPIPIQSITSSVFRISFIVVPDCMRDSRWIGPDISSG